MSFFHANQREALNQSLAEVQGQINVSFEFFPPRTSEMEQTRWDNTLLQLSQATFPIVQGNIFIRTAINRSGISPIPLSKKMA